MTIPLRKIKIFLLFSRFWEGNPLKKIKNTEGLWNFLLCVQFGENNKKHFFCWKNLEKIVFYSLLTDIITSLKMAVFLAMSDQLYTSKYKCTSSYGEISKKWILLFRLKLQTICPLCEYFSVRCIWLYVLIMSRIQMDPSVSFKVADKFALIVSSSL